MAEGSQLPLKERILNSLKLLNSEGSIVRIDDSNLSVPPSQQASDENGGVLSKDVVFDSNMGLWLRLYFPPQQKTRIPVLIFFHGGGFCFGNPGHLHTHRFCIEWAANIGVIILSVKYRLAPEHRLPAAYEDATAVIEWVHSQSMVKRTGEADPWFAHADFSNVYLAGISAGGNIVHYLGIQACWKDWEDLRIRGMILLQPGFGAEERCLSETKFHGGQFLSLKLADMFWELALPVGTNRDHHFCNPLGEVFRPQLANAPLPAMLVLIGGHDFMSSRQKEYCEILEKLGKQVQMVEFEEEEHGFVGLKPENDNSHKLLKAASDFIKTGGGKLSSVTDTGV